MQDGTSSAVGGPAGGPPFRRRRAEPSLPSAACGGGAIAVSLGGSWGSPPSQDRARVHKLHGRKLLAEGCSAPITGWDAVFAAREGGRPVSTADSAPPTACQAGFCRMQEPHAAA